MDKTQIAIYFAGLFDGEGTIYINRFSYPSKPSYAPRFVPVVRLNMCDRKPLELAKETWGGSIHLNRVHYKNPNWRDTYMWTLSSKSVWPFLEAIKPYSIIKLPQLEAISQIKLIKQKKVWEVRERLWKGSRRTTHRHVLTQEAVKELDALMRELQLLKKRSVD